MTRLEVDSPLTLQLNVLAHSMEAPATLRKMSALRWGQKLRPCTADAVMLRACPFWLPALAGGDGEGGRGDGKGEGEGEGDGEEEGEGDGGVGEGGGGESVFAAWRMMLACPVLPAHSFADCCFAVLSVAVSLCMPGRCSPASKSCIHAKGALLFLPLTTSPDLPCHIPCDKDVC